MMNVTDKLHRALGTFERQGSVFIASMLLFFWKLFFILLWVIRKVVWKTLSMHRPTTCACLLKLSFWSLRLVKARGICASTTLVCYPQGMGPKELKGGEISCCWLEVGRTCNF